MQPSCSPLQLPTVNADSSHEAASVGRRFVDAFNATRVFSRGELVNYYHAEARLTYQGVQAAGKAAIEGVYSSQLGYSSFNTTLPSLVDTQPTEGGGVLVVVQGHMYIPAGCNSTLLLLPGQQQQQQNVSCSETFLLRRFWPSGSYFIVNHVLRLQG